MSLFSRHNLLRRGLIGGSAFFSFLPGMLTASAQTPGATPLTPPTRGPYQFGPGPIVPAASLTAPTSPQKLPTADGFIQRWLILDPIPATGLTQNTVQSEVKKKYFPDQFSVLPHDGDKVTVNGTELTWHAVDTKNYNVNLFQLARSLGKPTTDVLFWAVTVIESSEEMQDVRLAIGSNAASVWWLNGQEVIGIYGDRQTVVDDGVSKRVTLKKGANVVRVAVVNGGGATDFCARFLDAHDKPLTKFTTKLPKP